MRSARTLLERLEFGLAQSDAALAEAYAVFARTQRGFPAAMEGLDVLVTPSAPGEAPAGIEWTGDPAFNFIWTSLHVPCVTVPAGHGARTGCRWGSRSSGARATTGRCSPGPNGWPRRSGSGRTGAGAARCV